MRLPRPIQRALHRFGVHMTHWDETITARRGRLLAHVGVEVMVDVGANVGQYASSLRDLAYVGRIVSCEPVAEAFAGLQRASLGDPLWDARRVALGRERGELALNVAANTVFSSALAARPHTIARDPTARAVRTERVPLTTLDALVHDEVPEQAILGVKIDAQGFERDVIAGGEETVRRARYLEVELSCTPVYEGEASIVELLALLYERGFELALIEDAFIDRDSGRMLQVTGIFTRSARRGP